mmetsp:Transcript_14854/g.20401  ORF Transcript_14854/g.20401 Transcript_14854/m.20401 type:complete len:80 (+) Transcript_14854:475-714(+)
MTTFLPYRAPNNIPTILNNSVFVNSDTIMCETDFHNSIVSASTIKVVHLHSFPCPSRLFLQKELLQSQQSDYPQSLTSN